MSKLFSSLFPRKCVFCGEIIPDAGQSDALCSDCRMKYDVMCMATCAECGARETECQCGKVPSADMQRHLFEFSGEMSRKLIYTFKRQNSRALQEFFASEAARILERDIPDIKAFAVTYVPRNPASVRDFGFDHAQILAEKLAARLEIPSVCAFVHKTGKGTQKELSLRERAENAEMSYVSKSGVKIGENLIIVDDVVTSGSTLSRCASLARGMGAKRVVVFTLALTGKKISE